jgi:transposase
MRVDLLIRKRPVPARSPRPLYGSSAPVKVVRKMCLALARRGFGLRLHRNTLLQVIHRRPKADQKAGHRAVVNNLAEAAVAAEPISGDTAGGRHFAAASLRSAPPHPTRVLSRKPATLTARVQKSERTLPQEGRRISSTMNRVTSTSAAATKRKESEKMKTWNEVTNFAGFDWAKDHHDVLVLDNTGKITSEFRFDHTATGWTLCQEKLKLFPELAIAVEAGHSAAIERLVALGYRVYPVHPRSSKSYRTRKLPSGTKTDRRDCWALADALRLEGESWRVLTTPEPLVQQLRLLCRDEVTLIEQRTALVNQLQQALYEYYPAALEAFPDWTHVSAWAFVECFPTPQALAQAGKRKWQNFLHAHKLFHPEVNQKRLEIFARADRFCGPAPVIAAKSALAVAVAKILQTLEAHLARYRSLITECFKQHPDQALFTSLPGAGPKLAPRLLGELIALKPLADIPQALQCLAGMAPVSYQSGKVSVVYLRHQCNRFLRHTIHLWVDLSRHYCDWARIYYEAHRKKGQSHACALRCLGMRWLKIIAAMIRNQKPYDAATHTRNQLQHGSWVMQLQPV